VENLTETLSRGKSDEDNNPVLTWPDGKLYDDTEAKWDEWPLREGLSDEEIEEAEFIRPYTLGLMIVSGMLGAGKDTFATMWSWLIKRYFPGRHVLRDEKPRQLFGSYTPFTPQLLMADLERMKREATGEFKEALGEMTAAERSEALVEKWVKQRGHGLLQYSVVHLTEFHKYMDCHRTGSKVNHIMGSLIKYTRHLDMLIIGNAQIVNELDRQRCLPYVNYEVRCRPSRLYEGVFIYTIYKGNQITHGGAWEVNNAPPEVTYLRALEETPALKKAAAAIPGYNGKARWVDLFNSKAKPQI